MYNVFEKHLTAQNVPLYQSIYPSIHLYYIFFMCIASRVTEVGTARHDAEPQSALVLHLASTHIFMRAWPCMLAASAVYCDSKASIVAMRRLFNRPPFAPHTLLLRAAGPPGSSAPVLRDGALSLPRISG